MFKKKLVNYSLFLSFYFPFSSTFETESAQPALYQEVFNQNHDENAISKLLKTISVNELLNILEKITSSSATINPKLLHIAHSTIAELSIREFGKKNAGLLNQYIENFKENYNFCFLAKNYLIEKAGISSSILTLDIPDDENQEDCIIHIRPGKSVSAIIDAWYRSPKEETFENYIKNSTTIEEKRELLRGRVIYLSEKSLSPLQFTISFENSQLKIDGQILQDGRYMFTLDSEGKTLLVGKKIKTHGQRFHHSSFFSGEPTQSAGVLNIVSGKIESIRLSSGHYKPKTVHGENLLNFLKQPENLGEFETSQLTIAF